MLIESLENRQLLSSYFVDADGGLDGNDGLSEQTPFATIGKVNSLNLQPGDSVSFQGGDTFNDTIRLNSFDAGGTTDLTKVVIGSYGTGRATIVSKNDSGIQVVNTAGIEVTNLNFVGLRNTDPNRPASAQVAETFSGVHFLNTLPGNKRFEYVRVNNVEVQGYGNYGILIEGTADKSGFQNVVIDGVDVHHNTHGGIGSLGHWDNTSTEYAHYDVTVSKAKVWKNTGYAGSGNHTGDGIVMADVRGVKIVQSEAFENGELNTHVGGPVGVWVWDVDKAYIAHNESHHNKTNSTADGGGFDFDGGVTNSVMEYNYSHHNDGAGYGIYQFGGARAFYNNHVRYNISADDGRKNSYGAIDFWNGNGTNGIRDTHVYNNTVYMSPSTTQGVDRKGKPITVKLGDPRALRFISGTVDVTLYSNIFQTTGGVPLAQIDARQTNLRMDGNNWSASTGTFSLKVFAKVYTTFGAYVSGTGHDKNGRNLDPKMENPSSAPIIGRNNLGSLPTSFDNFKLRSDSPLALSQNAGLNLNVAYALQFSQQPFIKSPTTDFYGKAAPGEDGRFTIGAYDFL